MKYNIKVSKLEDGSYKLKINNYSRYEVEEVEALAIKYLQTQLQQKEKIIKEVREYIEKHTYHDTPKKLQNGIYERGELIIKNDFYIEDLVDILKGSDKE